MVFLDDVVLSLVCLRSSLNPEMSISLSIDFAAAASDATSGDANDVPYSFLIYPFLYSPVWASPGAVT